MSKVIKLSEEEIQRVKEGNDRITQLIYAIGQVEVEKSRLQQELQKVQSEQNNLGSELFEKYGKGNISLETGEITLEEDAEPTE